MVVRPECGRFKFNICCRKTLFTKGSSKTPYDCKGEHIIASYRLIGTVWMKPNTYVRTTKDWEDLSQVDGVGSVNLANSTAETFVQVAKNTPQKNVQNCFLCHNP